MKPWVQIPVFPKECLSVGYCFKFALWWHVPIFPASWEAEAGGSPSLRPVFYEKNKWAGGRALV
jgi:hypothetical protein